MASKDAAGPEEPAISGYLLYYRVENGQRVWSRRWFTVLGDNLVYGRTPDRLARRCKIRGGEVTPDFRRVEKYQFKLVSPEVGSLYLRAESAADLDRWLAALEIAVSGKTAEQRKEEEAQVALVAGLDSGLSPLEGEQRRATLSEEVGDKVNVRFAPQVDQQQREFSALPFGSMTPFSQSLKDSTNSRDSVDSIPNGFVLRGSDGSRSSASSRTSSSSSGTSTSSFGSARKKRQVLAKKPSEKSASPGSSRSSSITTTSSAGSASSSD